MHETGLRDLRPGMVQLDPKEIAVPEGIGITKAELCTDPALPQFGTITVTFAYRSFLYKARFEIYRPGRPGCLANRMTGLQEARLPRKKGPDRTVLGITCERNAYRTYVPTKSCAGCGPIIRQLEAALARYSTDHKLRARLREIEKENKA